MKQSTKNAWEQSESDSVVREVRSVREAYGARSDYDLRRMVEDLKVKENEHPERCAKLKPLAPVTAA